MFGGGYEALYAQIGNDATTVQRCRIVGGGWWALRIAGSNFVLANNFLTGTSHYGICAGLATNPLTAANLKIWNNSICLDHTTSGAQYCSLRWYSSLPGTEVVNNVFVDNYPTATTTGFNVWCYNNLAPTVMRHNCLWRNQPNTFPVYFANASQTLAQWQLLGFDANSLQADPLFVAPAATPPDLRLQSTSPCTATGATLAGVTTDLFAAPRTPPFSIGAHERDIQASYAVFGPGCAGSAGVPSNTASAPPRIGQASVITFGNLPPPFLAVAMIGLSNAASTFGALPLDLAAFGAPGCFGRVSPDATIVLVGSGGNAAFPFGVPMQPTLAGFRFYTQGLALDPLWNTLGASTTDAAAAVIGH